MSTNPALWIPCAVFAHAFAALWLIRAFLLLRPAATAGQLASRVKAIVRKKYQLPTTSSSSSSSSNKVGGPDLKTASRTQPATGSSTSISQNTAQFTPSSPSDVDTSDNSLDECTGSSSPFSGAVAIVLPLGECPAAQPLKLSWHGIGCSYKTTVGEHITLQDVMGQAVAGQMQAIIGPSGAAKSTLLDILAARKVTGQVTGSITVNEVKLPQNSYRRLVAYVPQEDHFSPVLTCREALQFQAAMLLPDRPRRGKEMSRQQPAPSAPQGPSPRSSWPETGVPAITTSQLLQHGQECGQQGRQQEVAQVLEMMGLSQQALTLVGGRLPGGLLLRGLSGGERRRLSIAAAFLATPSIIFLDEPTSGLDSSAALSVMLHLQQLAASDRVVVAAIHQPRSAIWSLFDWVTLLASGLLVYTGPAAHMQSWLTGGLGYCYDPACDGLVSDWALDQVVVVDFGQPAQALATITTFEELQAAAQAFKVKYQSGLLSWQQTDLDVALEQPAGAASPGVAVDMMPHRSEQQLPPPGPSGPFSRGGSEAEFSIHNDSSSTSSSSSSSQTGVPHTSSSEPADWQLRPSGYTPPKFTATEPAGSIATSSRSSVSCGRHTSWWQQYKALVWREAVKVTRNPADVAGRTLTFAWVALLVGLVYYDMPADASSIRQRLNVLFSTLCFFVLMPFINMSIYAEDKGLYLADVSANLYRPSAYYCAKVTVVMPFHVLSSLCALFIQYGMTGLRPGPESIFKHGAIATLVFLIAAQVLHLASTTMPNTDLAFMLAIGWTCVQLVMSGFFIPYKEMQISALANLRYLSAMQYALQGLLQVELGSRLFPCPPASMDSQTAAFLTQLLPGAGSLLQPSELQQLVKQQSQQHRCVVDSSAVVSYFGFDQGFGITMAALSAYLVCMHVITFVAMLVVARREVR